MCACASATGFRTIDLFFCSVSQPAGFFDYVFIHIQNSITRILFIAVVFRFASYIHITVVVDSFYVQTKQPTATTATHIAHRSAFTFYPQSLRPSQSALNFSRSNTPNTHNFNITS